MHDSISTPDAAPAGANGTRPLTEAELRAAVAAANVPALLMVVFQVTGDERWLQPPYVPTRGKGLGDHDSGGLPEAVQDEVRDAAVDAIRSLQERGEPAIAVPSPEQMTRMISVCMGEEVDERYGDMLSTEFARRIAPEQVRQETVAPPAGFKVLVIGAGLSGITAAHQLEQMGVEYEILERNTAPGGNWLANRYPGCGVDTPSYLYSLSFGRRDWSKHFELRPSLQSYFADVLRTLGVEQRVRFGTEVLEAQYDADAAVWRVDVRNADGHEEQLAANVLISAVGVLNRPILPSLPGMETFDGVDFHSSSWPADLSLAGKRVAVVGTGASAMQIVPAIVDEVEHLTVFQRSPAWVAPFEKFQQEFPRELRELLQSCDLYYGWYWLRLFWQFGDRVIEALRVDPEWEHPERAVNERNDGHREFFTRYAIEQLEGRDELLEKVIPDYPPYGKRILLDNGWYDALCRDNVTFVNEAVVEVRPQSVVSASGDEYAADVVVWATGFDAARFISSLDIRGLDGEVLRDAWNDDDPRAYLGVSVPRFPNLFMLGGPNSFPGSGSFTFFMETQMRYVRGLLNEMFRRGIRAVDATEQANADYNDLVDSLHAQMVWTHPGMTTYYRNSIGRVIFVMPFLNLDYWNMTSRPDLENYTLR
jgi:4-hydroxyacetophenone monooxygenase